MGIGRPCPTSWRPASETALCHRRSGGPLQVPLLHNTMCALLGLDFTYACRTVHKEELAAFLTAAKESGCAGFNATMPFKELLLPYLDGLDPLAKKLGAVNTICIECNKLYGYNTDCPGYTAALRQHGFDPQGKQAVLLGAGGAAKAVALGLSEAGATVLVANRTASKAKAITSLCPDKIRPIPWPTADAPDLAGADLLVNATSLGMAGQGSFPTLPSWTHSPPPVWSATSSTTPPPPSCSGGRRRGVWRPWTVSPSHPPGYPGSGAFYWPRHSP